MNWEKIGIPDLIRPKMRLLLIAVIYLSCYTPHWVYAQQQLSLKDALKVGVETYGTIKAKEKYVAASEAGIEQAKLDYLPNLNLAAQVDYGSANGLNGPAYAFGPSGIATTGLPIGSQSWNAAFGSLYLAHINWDFFSFGRSRQKINVAGVKSRLNASDLQQEIFQHEVRIAAAYLNLLAAQRLTNSYRENLARADTLRDNIVRKGRKELLAGVDSSQANAEVSNAQSILLRAMTYEDEQNSILIKLLNVAPQRILADTVFIATLPQALSISKDTLAADHPILEYYKNRIRFSDQQAKYYKTLNYPTISLGAALQGRGSGFGTTPASGSISEGLNVDRTNYVMALGITWNLTQPLRVRQQVKSQWFISEGLKDEMELTRQQLATQLDFSESKIKNAIADYYETPQQVKAASDAYLQKTVLYDHGLTTLVDVTQALYALVRAETDRDIAYNNVWQALLLKAASIGDFNLFYKNL